jgi:hypothetical protein
MRLAAWLNGILWALLVVVVVACGSSPGEPTPSTPSRYASVPGIEAAAPLSEYRLILILDAAKRRLMGRQQVTFPNRTGAELNEVVFRLYPNLPQYGGWMRVGPVWVDGQRGTSELRTGDTSLLVPLFEALEPEASVTVSMTFDIEIPHRTGGYVLFGYSQNIWSMPDAYPLLAIHDGSTWREDQAPAYGDAVSAAAALYEVTLTLPQTLTLATTGSVVDQIQDPGGQHVYRIVGGPLREFTWLASADYAVIDTKAHGVDLRSFYLPDDEAAGQAALYTAAAALRIYSDAFGPYPYPEMTVVEAPLRYYGMEYPGLNLIGIALYRDQRAELEERVAHEIAHQWWYAQVGNDQINAPWLDEGLAEYSMATYYREVYGQARVNTMVNQRWLAPYQVKVENGLDAVVNQPAAAFGEDYEVMVYAKAALFFDALRQEVGPEVFEEILREYLARYRWRMAMPDNLLRVAESVSGQDLDGLYYRWILSKQ